MARGTLNDGVADAAWGASLGTAPIALRPSLLGDPIALVEAAVRAVLGEPRDPSRSRERVAASVFPGRLFSLRHAEALAPGTQSVRIAPGTVVTPLAQALLKRQGVAVQLAGVVEFGATASGAWAFAIDSDLGSLHALRRSLLEDAGLWIELSPSLGDVTGWIQGAGDRGAVLVTPDGASAVWRACQAPGVRAAAVSDPAEVDRAARSMGANLIVVEPAGKSPSWIKQLATAFRRAGAPTWPGETER